MQVTGHCLNLLSQTADLRFSPRWESVRALLATRGLDAQQVALLSCDHAGGVDMALWLALPGGGIAECIMREEVSTRRYTAITEWRFVAPDLDQELLLAARVTSEPHVAAAFTQAVESFHHFRQSLTPTSTST